MPATRNGGSNFDGPRGRRLQACLCDCGGRSPAAAVDSTTFNCWERGKLRVCVSRLGVEEPPARIVFHQCGFRGCRIGEASNPGPVQTRQARRLETMDSARHPGPTSRRRRRALPWSWDGDTESDTDPILSAVGTQVDSSDVPSELLERDCEASHSGPHNADVTAPGRSMLVSTQVDSNDEFASQFAVQDDSGARSHGAVFADDFSQPRLKRLRLVSRGAPAQSKLHVADCGTRVEPVPSRRVVLVPGSPDDTPRCIQDRSCASNRFSVLAESDAWDPTTHRG